MNEYQREMMDKPSHLPQWCSVCGNPNTTKHHIVPRSQGGRDGPRISLCGNGTMGHHGAAEDKKLHFRYRKGWEYFESEVSMKYEQALEQEGWMRAR